jgi:hypothetical protein
LGENAKPIRGEIAGQGKHEGTKEQAVSASIEGTQWARSQHVGAVECQQSENDKTVKEEEVSAIGEV